MRAFSATALDSLSSKVIEANHPSLPFSGDAAPSEAVSKIDISQPSFGELLYRERGCMPLKKAADNIGISRQTLAAIERDEVAVTDRQFHKICGVFKRLRHYRYLIGRVPTPPTLSVALVKPTAQASTIPTSDDLKSACGIDGGHAEKSEPEAESMAAATFGQALRRVRRQEKMTSKEVGELVGVDQSCVCFWENDKFNPVEDNWKKLLDIFPQLREAPMPDVRPISKPVGSVTGSDRAPALSKEQLDEVRAANSSELVRKLLATIDEKDREIERLRAVVEGRVKVRDHERSAPTPAPVQTPAAQPAAAVEPMVHKSAAVRWARLTHAVMRSTDRGVFVGLMGEAKAFAFTFDEVIESVTPGEVTQ